MTYNKETEDVSIDAVYEKSRDIENVEYGDYSVSNCFKFSYNGKVIVATSFKRNIDIDDVQNPALINNSTISEYNFLRFDLSSNTVLTEITDFDEEGSLKNSIVNSIKETFVTLNNVNLLTNGVNAQEIDISVTLLNASSAENISQLV